MKKASTYRIYGRTSLTSKLLFLAVESCNALTQISATSAQLIAYITTSRINIMALNKAIMVHDISPERFCFLDQRSVHADRQVLPAKRRSNDHDATILTHLTLQK